MESQKRRDLRMERGTHIYKHVIKGWTMDPTADDGFKHKNISPGEESHDEESKISLSELEHALEEGISVYRYEI